MMHSHIESLGRFNAWERQVIEANDIERILSSLFDLYDLMPERVKQRPVSIEGIIKMHEALACLA